MSVFHLIRSGVVVRSCEAPDVRVARERLQWRDGMLGHVQSDASWKLSYAPRGDGAAERRTGKDFRDKRAGRKPDGLRTGKAIAASRDGSIRRGIARRANDRESA